MYLYLWRCACVCERGGQPWEPVLTFHLARGGLFASGPLCPLLHLPPPCLSCWVRLLTGFWGLKSRSSSLHTKRFYPVSKAPAPRHRFDAFSIAGELSGGSAVSLQSQPHWTQSHQRDGPAPLLHLTEGENKTVQSCKRLVTKAGPHNLRVSKVAYGLKRVTQPWRFWSAYGHDGTNRNYDCQLWLSAIMIYLTPS